jgi:CBS domain-containing protein
MEARDVMRTPVLSVDAAATVKDIARILLENRISAVPVVGQDGVVIGIVSEGDLMRRPEIGTEQHPSWWLSLLANPTDRARDYVKHHGLRANDVMTRDVVTVAEDASLEEIAALLERKRIKRVPVTRDGKLVGIVSRANLLQGLAVWKPPAARSASDREIRAAIENTLRKIDARSQFVNIVVSDGVAYLWGGVYSSEEKEALRLAAETTAGVKRVEDNIGLFPHSVRTTMWAD